MILVLLGTQDNSFERLLKEIENCIDKNVIKEEVIVQAGNTKYVSNKMKIYDFFAPDKLNELIKKSNYVITHGGVGSIIQTIRNGKKVIAVPRKQEYKEHVNNHQMQIVENFDIKGYIIGLKEVQDLSNAIVKVHTFEPEKYVSNTENFIKIIEDYIDNNQNKMLNK